MSLAAVHTSARTIFGASLSRAAGLIGAIVAISALRYPRGGSDSIWHELSLRSYYLPILMSAY
jgi:hypothetical protein